MRDVFVWGFGARWALPIAVCAASIIQPPSPVFGLPADSGKTTTATKDISSMDLEALLNVKVTTASKFSEDISDAPGVMHVITRDELLRFHALTLAEILNHVPGLALTTASFTDRSMVASRGDQTAINSGHILYLINGRPTREVMEGGIASDLLESFPVGILDHVEIILGPGSVLYGSNAYAAVVNLITRKADGNKITLDTQGGPGNAFQATGEASFQRGAFSLVAAERSHQNPDWNTPVNTLLGIQNATIPDRGKGAYLEADYKGLSLISSYTDWKTAYDEVAVGQGLWRRGFGDLGYRANPTKNWTTNLNLTFTRTTLDARDYIPNISRDSYDVVFEWANHMKLGERDELTFGALYDFIRGAENLYLNGTTSVISNGSRSGTVFYGQVDHKLLNNLKVIGGIQGNKIGNLSFNVVPRAGVIWKPAPHYTVKALYSEAFRAPSINENHMNYAPYGPGGPGLFGDPNLKPEHVATSDFDLLYGSNRVEAEINYFYSRQTNDIVLKLINSTGGELYSNLGKATFQGGELEVKYYLHRDIFLDGAGSYQGNHDGSGNQNITPVPNLAAKAGVSYQSKVNGITASFFDVHQGPFSGYSQATNPKPTAYDLLNAHFGYDLSKYSHSKGFGLALTAQGNDLLNKSVWLPDWNDIPGDTIFFIRGRTLFAGMVLSF
jgi:outer membrane receptor for ferrienterochelin and colicin